LGASISYPRLALTERRGLFYTELCVDHGILRGSTLKWLGGVAPSQMLRTNVVRLYNMLAEAAVLSDTRPPEGSGLV
jgi:hypothetical protein